MKPISLNACLGAVVLSAICVPTIAPASGPYVISWNTIDGGGGISSGGNYELLGGFWPGGPLCMVEFEDFAKFSQQ